MVKISEELDNTSIQEIFQAIEDSVDDDFRVLQVKRAWVKIIGARVVRRSIKGVMTVAELHDFDGRLEAWTKRLEVLDQRCKRCQKRTTMTYCADCA